MGLTDAAFAKIAVGWKGSIETHVSCPSCLLALLFVWHIRASAEIIRQTIKTVLYELWVLVCKRDEANVSTRPTPMPE